MTWHGSTAVIGRYLHGDATATEALSLEAHLPECERCREALAHRSDRSRLDATWTAIEHRLHPAPAGEAVTMSETAEREMEPQPAGPEPPEPQRLVPRRERPRRPLLVAAAAFAVTILVGGIAALIALNIGEDEVPPANQTSTTAATTTLPTTTAAPTTAAVPSTVAPPTSVEPSTTAAAAPPVQTAVTWERVPDQAGLERSYLMTVTAFDGRLFAGGYVLDDACGATDYFEDWCSDAMVWVSDDGSAWQRVDAAEGVFGVPVRREEIDTLLDGPDGLLAIGLDSSTGLGGTTVVWASPDGGQWRRVAEIEDFGLGAVVPGGPGFVAAVEDPAAGAGIATSADGSTWTRVDPAPFASLSPGFTTSVFDLAATGTGFVAVGVDPVGDHLSGVDTQTRCAAVWYSEDGAAWQRVDAPRICEEEEGLYSVSATPDGAVVASGSYFVWSSTDPADPDSWEPIAEADAASACAPVAWAGDVGVAIDCAEFIAVSDDGGAAWLGVDLTRPPFDDGNLTVTAVAASGDRFVAVGGRGVMFPGTYGITGGGVGAVWIGAVER